MAGDAELLALGAALRRLVRASYGLLPDELPAIVADAVADLGGRNAVLFLVDLDQLELRPFEPPGRTDAAPWPVEGSAAGEAFQQERAVVEDTSGGRRLWLPLLDSSERMGVLHILDDGDVSLEAWIDLASLVAELLSSKERYGDAVALARRHGRVTVAAEMRYALLPPLTFTSPLVSISGVLQPSHAIAGDAFDYAVDAGCAHVGVFDAMGHGLEASRIANLVVGTYRSSRRRGASLVDALVAMDEVVVGEFGDARFATVQLASLDLETGALQVASAGHPGPVVLRRGRPPEALRPAPSRPVGLGFSGGAVVETELEPGDAVLFHTDGVADARSPDGAFFGEDRMARRAAELLETQLGLAEVLRRVIREAIDFQGTDVRDDASLVLVRWRPKALGQPQGPIERSIS